VACGAGLQTPESVLEEQIDMFHQHLRWGRFEEAAVFLTPAERERFLDEFDRRSDDFQITDVDVRRVEMRDDPRRAIVVMTWQSFELPSTIVQTTRWRETWEYDMTLRMWKMTERERLPTSGRGVGRSDEPIPAEEPDIDSEGL
jgi:hypothetical protein